MSYTTVLSNIPKKITAGESVSWSVTLDNFPASAGWVVTYTLVKSDTRIQIVSTADGINHLVEIPYTTTADYTAGEYRYQSHVSNAVERYQVATGIIEVLPDFATKTTGHDARTWLEIAIDALEAAIEGRASKTQLQQSINGIQVQHLDLNDQLTALSRLKRILAGKKIAKTGLKSMMVSF